MIYGANGYSGEMIARQAIARGMSPVLAGRNESALKNLARELKLEYRCFPCNNAEVVTQGLKGMFLVLHCAGPFSATSRFMGKACLQSKTHYLDITGEIGVFEAIFRHHESYKTAGIVAIPGVGFDVVPSDCLAALLQKKLPDANWLELTLKSEGPLSPGTTKTMLEGFFVGPVVRRSGKITFEKEFSLKEVRIGKKIGLGMGIPWGDVSTAYHSTGIPNISVYSMTNKSFARNLKIISRFKSLIRLPIMQVILKKLVELSVKGPQGQELTQTHYHLWGEVRNQKGEKAEMGFKTPNGYDLTVDAALHAVRRILDIPLKPGAYTPSKAFGAEFIYELKGIEPINI